MTMIEQPAPLWHYGRMMESAYQRQRGDFTIDLATAYWRMANEMRSDYEAERQRLTQANAELAAEVARLKAQLAEAESQNWAKRMTAIVDEINADVRNLRADK